MCVSTMVKIETNLIFLNAHDLCVPNWALDENYDIYNKNNPIMGSKHFKIKECK